jgi:hypothetical protein
LPTSHGPNLHEQAGVAKRKGSNQESVYETEDGRIRSDSKAQGNDYRHTEARLTDSLPESQTYVSQDGFHFSSKALRLFTATSPSDQL